MATATKVDKIKVAPRKTAPDLKSTLYRICVAFLKIFERIYAPLTAGQPASLDLCGN